MPLIYKLSDDVPTSLRQVLSSRGWQEWCKSKHKENEWTMCWTTKRYVAKELYGLHPSQKVNHFRNTSSITKKDNLLRNLRRMKSTYGKIYDFFPQSWMIPLQFSEFLRVKKSDDSIWIAKPSSGRRGENISIFRNISQFSYNESMIIQKYISNPLLIGGYKFDLRLYILVTSFRPLKIWLFDDGLCRFSTETYDLSNLENTFSHLTNASINKESDTYDKLKPVIGHGSKWTLKQLFNYLITEKICTKIDVNKMIHKIRDIIILTLLSIVNSVEQNSHCFELFGFDIMIDDKFKCWLLEVNGSPAIAITCKTDQIVKNKMLNNLIQCSNVEKYAKRAKHKKHEKHNYKLHEMMEKMSISDKENINNHNNTNNNQENKNNNRSSNINIEQKQDESKNEVQYSDYVDMFEDDAPIARVGGFEQIYPFNQATEANNEFYSSQHSITADDVSHGTQNINFKIKRLTFTQTVVNEVKQRRTKKIKQWKQLKKNQFNQLSPSQVESQKDTV